MNSDDEAFPAAEDFIFHEVDKNTDISDFARNQDWYFYAKGYREAADILVNNLIQGDPRKLLFPIMYLYRHHLELLLKDIIRRVSCHYGSSEADGHYPVHHRIDALWNHLIGILQRESPGIVAEEAVSHASQLLTEFCKVDRNGETFRFPEDSGFNPHEWSASIDVIHVSRVVEKLSLLLECLDAAVFHG